MEINSFLREQLRRNMVPVLSLFIFIEHGSPLVLQTHLPWIWRRKRIQSGTQLDISLVS